jgi:hypothetical protein
MKQNIKQEKEKEKKTKKGKRPQGSYSAQLAKTRNGTWSPPLSLSLTARPHTSSPSSSPSLLSRTAALCTADLATPRKS